MYWGSACLRDVISYRMICFTGRHVLLEDVLLEGISYRRVFLQVETSYRSTCFTGRHILWDEDTSYVMTGLTGGYAYRRPCIT